MHACSRQRIGKTFQESLFSRKLFCTGLLERRPTGEDFLSLSFIFSVRIFLLLLEKCIHSLSHPLFDLLRATPYIRPYVCAETKSQGSLNSPLPRRLNRFIAISTTFRSKLFRTSLSSRSLALACIHLRTYVHGNDL